MFFFYPHFFPHLYYFEDYLEELFTFLSFFLFLSLVLSCFSFPRTFFYFLNLPFIPPCSCFMDVVHVVIFACCKNHIIYVSFPYVVSASSHSLVCLSWSLSSIVEMSSKLCLTDRSLALSGCWNWMGRMTWWRWERGSGEVSALSMPCAYIHLFTLLSLAQCSRCHLCLRTLQSRIPLFDSASRRNVHVYSAKDGERHSAGGLQWGMWSRALTTFNQWSFFDHYLHLLPQFLLWVFWGCYGLDQDILGFLHFRLNFPA